MSQGIKEVIWEGKYDAEGKSQRPDPVALTSGNLREYNFPLMSDSRSHAALFAGDNMEAMAYIKRFFENAIEPIVREHDLDLIYIDPPFDIGREMPAKVSTGKGSIEVPAYDDRWGEDKESFAYFMWERLILMREILSQRGSIFVHTNDHCAPLMRALLDDVFGEERFVNQIIWHYTGGGRAKSRFSNKHDVILWYSKNEDFIFNADAIRIPYAETSGYAKSGIKAASGKRYTPNTKGKVPSDVWEIPIVNPMAKERTGYPTQKPIELMERILLAASEPEFSVVADFFCGSGSFVEAALKHDRCVYAADASGLALSQTYRRIQASGKHFALYMAKDHQGPGGSISIEIEEVDEGTRLGKLSPFDAERGDEIVYAAIAPFGIGFLQWETREFRPGMIAKHRKNPGAPIMLCLVNRRGEWFFGELSVHHDGQANLRRIL